MSNIETHGIVLWAMPRFHREIQPLAPARTPPKAPELLAAPPSTNSTVMPTSAGISSNEPAAA